ncbi:MAG TPA: hypothetical protein VG387_14155 [Rhizomicrobium sp.]|jgi:hypothetical protein|nr:hypothetical protein [Rhizomicrobium sp.]
MIFVRIAAVALLAASLAGCAMNVAAPQASFDGIQAVRAADLPPMTLGSFVPGGSVSASDDRSTTVRAINTLDAPGGSFAGFLKDTLAADLKGAGRLDANAPLTLSGVLTKREVDSTVGTGTASLAADFTLTKGGKTVFDKTLSVSDSWDSSFLGAVAIPDAVNHFTGLFGKLSLQLLSDPDFKAAAHAP